MKWRRKTDPPPVMFSLGDVESLIVLASTLDPKDWKHPDVKAAIIRSRSLVEEVDQTGKSVTWGVG